MIYQRSLLSLLLFCVWGTAAAAQQSAAGGDFTLTDHNGEKFRLADQRGKVILLFFGYTSCTEACPVILGRVNSVFKQLGPDREKALAVFISVDPQRDTQQVLREYVKYFSAHTVALTGKKEEIDAVVKQYGAMYEIEKSDSALGYHVSHTTDIYLIDQRGALRSRFKHTDRAALMVDGVKGLFRNPHRRAAVDDAKRGHELLARIIAAMGGGQKIDGLTSYADVHKATAKLPQGDQEVEGRWIIEFVRGRAGGELPDRVREEVTIDGPQGKQLTVNSRIEFTGSKVTGSESGRFEQFTGAIELVEGNPEKSRVSVEIEMNSVVTQSRGLEEHLKTADFFEVERFPKSSFVSTAIRSGGAGNGAYTVTGNLELRGVKKSIAFPAVIRVEADAMTVDSEFAISRKDFGIVYAGRTNDLIRDEVALKLTIKAQRPKLSQR